jgi:hypothetical protein
MKAIVTVVVAICSLGAVAQQSWQKIQMPTAAEVAETWGAPPPEYGPEPYYGLNGAVNETVIARDLDRMKMLGYQAVTVQAGYDMPFAYLSPEYFTFFRAFVAEAKKRNMRVWIVDDAGYPSGFAGGKFTELKPEMRMQALVAAQRIAANAGETAKAAVGPATVAVTAINADDGSAVTVPVADHAVTWTAPPGHWTVMVVEHQFKTSPTRSDGDECEWLHHCPYRARSECDRCIHSRIIQPCTKTVARGDPITSVSQALGAMGAGCWCVQCFLFGPGMG